MFNLNDYYQRNFFTDNLELDLNPDVLNPLQKEFLSIDEKDFKERLKFFIRRTYSIQQKYDLWKAMDYEIALKHIFSEDGIYKEKRFVKFINGFIDYEDLKENGNANIAFKAICKSNLQAKEANRCSNL